MTFFKKTLILSTLLLTGCSFFIELDQPSDKIVFKNMDKQVYCKKRSNLVLGSQTGHDLKLIRRNLLSTAKEEELRPIEVFAAWALIQMYLRPDKVSPYSALQLIDTKRSKNDYFSFNSQKVTKGQYLRAIQTVLKEYRSKKSLTGISRIVDKVMPNYYLIDDDLARNLFENRELLLSNKRTERKYFKGQQVLRNGEALRVYNMQNVVKSYPNKGMKFTNYLFEEKIGVNSSLKCNFDLNIYKKGVYLIEPQGSEMSHPFSLTYKGHTFMAVASQRSDYTKLAKSTYSFIPSSTKTQKAFCKISTQKNRLTLMSSYGRDSGQFLYNLLDYKIAHSSNKDEIIEILNFPRYIFLLGPKRMIYESERSSEEQTQAFLNTGFPIYHMPNLGNVWINFELNKESGLILDGRQTNTLSCAK
jgi:hypothetical protein